MVGAMSTIGERLKEVRLLRNLTQAQLAQQVGRSQEAISLLESGGTKEPSATTLIRVARVLRCSVRWLMTGTGTMDDRDIPTTEDEVELLVLTRNMSIAHRQALLATARALQSSQTQTQGNSSADTPQSDQ